MKSIDPEVLVILQEELQEISVSLLASPPVGEEVSLPALQDYVRRLQRLAAMLRPLHEDLLLQAITLLQKNILEWLKQGTGNARHSMWRLITEWPAEVRRYLDAGGSSETTVTITEFLSGAEWLLPMPTDIARQAVDSSAATPSPAAGLPTTISRADLSLQIPADVSQSLVVELLQELPDLTERLVNCIEMWASDLGKTDKLLEARRVAHTIKGAANVVGVRGIAVFTHLLEDVLQLPPGRDALVSTLAVRAASCLQSMTDALLRRASTPLLAEAVASALLATLHESSDIASGRPSTATDVVVESPSAAAKDAADQPEPAAPVGLRVSPVLVDDMFRLAGESTVSLHRLRETMQQARTLVQNLTRRASAATDHGHLLFPENDTKPLAFQPGEAHLRMQDLRETIADMQLLSEELQQQFMDIDVMMTRQERLSEELRNGTRQCRMLAAADIAPRLRRAVKEAARVAGKQITFNVIGGDTLVDAHVLRTLVDPLTHAIRNAADHGIETAEQRRRLGKSEPARITLSFVHEGSDVVVRCQDDGRGLDVATIRERAIARGLIAESEQLSEAQLARLIFEPGFSTREVASQISGRGIGMSAMVAKIEELKGLIEIYSQPGQGCCVEFRMPESLLSVGGLLVRLNSQTVGICSRGLQRVVMLEAARISGDTTPSVEIDGQILPVHRIESLLFGSNAPAATSSFAGQIPALVIRTGDIHAVVVVETILATRSLLIRRPGHYLRDFVALFGTTTLTDGSVVAVLDLVELLREPVQWLPTASQAGATETKDGPVAWIIDDSSAVRREISAQTAAAGYSIRLSEDGLQASEQLAQPPPALVVLDADMPGINGIELCARMRADPRFRTTPIVILSARGDACREEARKAGATLLLPKPCPRPLLQRMLERYPAPPRDQLALVAAAEDAPN